MSVCLSVREDISGTALAIFTNFFLPVFYACGSVFLRHVDDRSHRVSPGRGFSPLTMHISPEPHARSLPIFLCVFLMFMAPSSSGIFTIGHIAYRRDGLFFPIDNAYSSGNIHTRNLYELFCACCLCQWLGPPPTSLR